jgi:putative acetyltransferase
MSIRPYRDGDLEQVAQLFTDAVHSLARQHYDEVQRAAWAPRPPDIAEWRQRLAGLRTVLAEEDGRLAGFISYTPAGRIEMLFAAPAAARRGVASELYRHVESLLRALGIKELHTEASLVARAFFERHGFKLREAQLVTRRGASFRRFAMHKSLG